MILCYFHLLIGWSDFFIFQSEVRKQDDTSEDEWTLVDESMIDQMIHIHNQLFGSPDLVLAVSSLQITMSFVVPYFSW